MDDRSASNRSCRDELLTSLSVLSIQHNGFAEEAAECTLVVCGIARLCHAAWRTNRFLDGLHIYDPSVLERDLYIVNSFVN
jgi:hypothetical protein